MSAEPISQPSALACYLRVSSEEQKRKGTIETQRDVLTRYTDAQRLAVAGWYEDEAVSGYFVAFPNRPDGARLLADIRAGRVDTVLVRKLDRFGRNAREILNAVHELELAGARLISLKENVDTRTSAGRFFLTVLAGVAELERDMILERTEEGTARRLADTAWMGGKPPYGYVVVGKEESARLALNETPIAGLGMSEGDVVRLVYDLLIGHAGRGWGCQRIADHLTALGVPTMATRDGKGYKRQGTVRDVTGVWISSVVHRLVRKSVYQGVPLYTRADGTVVRGEAPAIVTPEVWQRAQDALAQHTLDNRRNLRPDRDYLLRGLIRCAVCGRTYGGTFYPSTRHVGAGGRYYVCLGKSHARRDYGAALAEAKRCQSVAMSADSIERQVWEQIERFAADPGPVLELIAAQMGQQSDAAEHLATELAAAQADLDAKQDERDRIVGAFRKGLITERDLSRDLDAISAEERQATHRRDDLAEQVRACQDQDRRLASARDVVVRLQARLAQPLTPEDRHDIVAGLVLSIIATPKPAGISRRGRPKQKPTATVTWSFERPAARQTVLTLLSG
jgi:site-specific DNA recombinase